MCTEQMRLEYRYWGNVEDCRWRQRCTCQDPDLASLQAPVPAVGVAPSAKHSLPVLINVRVLLYSIKLTRIPILRDKELSVDKRMNDCHRY